MATTKIPAEFLADNTIVALSIAENIISTRELAANGITSAQIASNAILTRHIDDNQITGDQIADNAVGTDQLAGIARGKIIVGDASGNPALLSLGSNGYVLKSDGSDIGWAEDATVAALTTEQVQDIAGAMFSSNTETGIAATYQDGDGTIDLVVGTLNQDTTGTAATVTGAAQSAITSLGTLTTLTVDNLNLNGSTLTASGDLVVDAAADINLDAGGGDWRLKDDGTTICTISNVSGDLQLLLGTADKDFKFQGTDGSSQITALKLDMSAAGRAIFNAGASFQDHVYLADSDKLILGGGDDLQIYHDGSNSYIDEVGTGILYIRSNDVRLMKADGSETMLQADDDGAVNLFHNNAVKLQTESGGVHITGYLDADNFKVAGAQGSDGQVLTSTGSGVAWEDAGGGSSATFKTFGTGSIMIGDNATGTIDAANYNTGLGVDIFTALTTADLCTAVGFNALKVVTTGEANTCIGEGAGQKINCLLYTSPSPRD